MSIARKVRIERVELIRIIFRLAITTAIVKIMKPVVS